MGAPWLAMRPAPLGVGAVLATGLGLAEAHAIRRVGRAQRCAIAHARSRRSRAAPLGWRKPRVSPSASQAGRNDVPHSSCGPRPTAARSTIGGPRPESARDGTSVALGRAPDRDASDRCIPAGVPVGDRSNLRSRLARRRRGESETEMPAGGGVSRRSSPPSTALPFHHRSPPADDSVLERYGPEAETPTPTPLSSSRVRQESSTSGCRGPGWSVIVEPSGLCAASSTSSRVAVFSLRSSSADDREDQLVGSRPSLTNRFQVLRQPGR